MNQIDYHEYSYVLLIVISFVMLINAFRHKKKHKNKKQKGGGSFGGCFQAIMEGICYILSFGTLCKDYKTTWSINCKGGGGDGVFLW
jgi:hypothetical protein